MPSWVGDIIAKIPDFFSAIILGVFFVALLYVFYYRYGGVSLSARSLVGLGLIITISIWILLRAFHRRNE